MGARQTAQQVTALEPSNADAKKRSSHQREDRFQTIDLLGKTIRLAYCPAGLGLARSNRATWIFRASPTFDSSQIPQKFGSTSYQVSP
jgi:hypothetical protein